MLMKYFETFRG